MRKQTKRIISMMLAVIMLFQLSGITQMDVFATEVEMESTSIVENDAEILYEDESQREEYSKRYRLSDGTWIAVVYDDAVHYQKDGEWKEINNTLKQEAESYTIPVERGKITGEYTVSGFVRSADGEPKVEQMDNILPEQSEEPEVSATPVPVETPMVTETPEPTEEPEVTVEPTEALTVTEISDAVVADEVEEEPSEPVDEDPVITPEITEMPEMGEIPAAEETPNLETETPVIESEPITENTEIELQPIVSPEITLEPIQPVFRDVTEQKWTNTDNDFIISLPMNLDGDSRVHVSSEGYDLYFAPVLENETADGEMSLFALREENAVAAEVLTMDKDATDDRMQKLEVKARSALAYGDVLPGVDLQYMLQSRALKETIVIECADDIPDNIGYIISAEGLTPVVNEDNSIDFVAGDRVIFCFPAPYMFDSANEYSYDINVLLHALDNGEYLLTYELDAEWLADAERVWPVSIDPVVNTPTTAANVQDTYINENSPSSNFYNYTSCYVAKLGTTRVRSLIHFDDMPTLTTSDVVLNAYLYMHGKGATSGGSIPVGAYAIIAPWTSSTVTWNNQPAHETEALDYQIVNSSNWAQYFCWDVTGAVSRWYVSTLQTGETEPSLKLPNYGIMLKTSLEGTNTSMQADFGTSEDLNGLVPQLIITYTSNSGIESFWDYTTQDVGRAGTVSVNNFTGNLMVSRTDMSYGGNLMPADMTFHYNYADNRIKLGYGVGWRMNYAQTITARTSTVNGATYSYYQWIDGDGTRRNFNLNNGVWEDETGQGYKLTINADTAESKYIIRDKENNRLGFDINGRLIKIVDGKNSGNYVFITYNAANSTDLRIKEVRDGAGRKYSFTYTTGSSGVSRLSSIVYKGTGTTALNTVSYTYASTGVLEKVTYNDGGQATYGYANDSTATAFITTVNNPVNGESVSVEYTGSTSNRYSISRVKKLTYKDGATVVSSASFVYGKNHTKVTDQQGCWCMYQFNDFGNTTSVYNDRGQAVFGKYAQDENSSNRANQLTSSSRLQDTVTNLILDPSFEKGSSLWVMGNATLDGAVSSTGTKSVKMDSEGKSVSYSFNAVAGTTYTVSAAVKATEGGHIQIEVLQGNSLVKASEPLSSEDWDRLELTFSASGSTTVRFKAVQMSSGVVYLDDVQLEKTSASSRYNLVTDPDMTNAAYWERTLNPQDGTIQSYAVASPANLDQSGLVITASPDTYKFVQQRITIPDGKSGDRYTFGVWVKSASVPLDNGRYPGDTAERRCGIKVKAMSGTTEVASETVLINDSCKEWQYICGSLDTDAVYDSILVCLLFDYGYNNAIFDGVQLFRENFGYHYEYDDNGNVTTITDVAGNKTTYTYNSNFDVTKIKFPDNTKYSYTYDTSRRLTQTTTPSGVKTVNEYDGNGNIKSVTISGNGTTQSIVSGSTYEGNGNMTKTVTTADRQTITYVNIPNKSLVESVTNPKGQVTNYGYETNTDRLTRVSRNGSTLTYGYAADAVSTIAHTGGSSTTYTFNYGVADILSSVKAGSTTLVTNAYNDFIWNLASQTYANGNVWSYEYYTDKNGHRTTELKYKSTTAANGTALKYVYYYSNEGAVGRIEYFEGTTLKQVEKYYYDTSDRLCRVVGTNGATTPALLYEYSWTYDNNNNVTAVTEKIGNTSTQYEYSYNNEQLPEEASYGDETVQSVKSFAYDGYGRVNEEVVNRVIKADNGSTTSTQISKTELNYKLSDDGSYMTNQVGSYTNAWNGASETLSYKYDANGNIIEISGGLNVTYAYDANDQLTLEKNTTANKAWAYTYDSGGNITKKTIYTNASANVIASEVSYTYDTTWGDKLTKVGTKSVTSDPSGNITAYNGWNYTWQGGRQLYSASATGKSLTFTYNDSGLRTSKNYNGTTHTYTYNGSLLASDVTNSYGLYFRYDQNGSPIGFAYKEGDNAGEEYYYIKNLQGDITGIVDSSGTRVATYTYDAWGDSQGVTSNNADNMLIAERNPLRYRSYVYDSESGLYYLQSRYYSPEIGRFISADAYAMTYETPIGANMFAYCGNNPVMNIDPTGDVFGTVFDIVSLGYSIYQAAKNPDDPMAKLAVVADAASLLIPMVSGGGAAVRAGAKAGKVLGATGAAKHSDEMIQSMQALCFVAGTPVLVENGSIPIEDISVGDVVWAGNPETGENALKRVVRTFVNETNELIHLTINGEKITCTPNHPFYSPVKGWTAACKLRAGDILVTVNGEYVVLELVQHELLESPISVYNFEVEDFHTYYVGQTSVLAHNRCSMPENYSPVGARRHGTFRKAKADLGIPVSQHPDAVLPNYDKRGNLAPGRVYVFGDKFIRDDVIGHAFPDGTSIPRHFNTSDKKHYFY